MLYEIIRDLKGCQFAHVVLETSVKIPKKYGIDGNITKIFDGEVQLNYTYENAVNNRLEKQGDKPTFDALSLPWGDWEIVNKIVMHKGKRYLRYYLVNNKSNVPNVDYYVNGRKATPQEVAIIKAYQSNGFSNRQAASGLTENQVHPRVVEFSNILEVKVGGKTYHKVTMGMVG